MTEPRTAHARPVPAWAVLLISIVALVLATAALTATLVAGGGSFRMMGGTYGGSMMGGSAGGMGGWDTGSGPAPQPGETGFVAGTLASPRAIRIFAGPGYDFRPSTIAVASGETVTFLLTTMGPTTHEFMIGPAAAVASDTPGTPELADIGMMQTEALTYTFDGPGPYTFACHAEGHYEAGMRGIIVDLP
jgi:plastocyanin